MTVKFLNCKDIENVLTKKKVKGIDLLKIASNVLPDSRSIVTEHDDGWWNVSHERKKRLFISQDLFPYYQYIYGLVKEKKNRRHYL